MLIGCVSIVTFDEFLSAAPQACLTTWFDDLVLIEESSDVGQLVSSAVAHLKLLHHYVVHSLDATIDMEKLGSVSNSVHVLRLMKEQLGDLVSITHLPPVNLGSMICVVVAAACLVARSGVSDGLA